MPPPCFATPSCFYSEKIAAACFGGISILINKGQIAEFRVKLTKGLSFNSLLVVNIEAEQYMNGFGAKDGAGRVEIERFDAVVVKEPEVNRNKVNDVMEHGQAVALVSPVLQELNERTIANIMRYYLEALIEASNDAIMAKTLSGQVVCWNKGAERLYGFTSEEMLGDSISIIMPADRKQEMVDIIQRICRGEQVERYETVRIRKDGTLIDVSLTASPIKDAQGGILGVVVIAHDITERKRIERELREKEQRKDDFISIASHELKTPITSIKAMTQFLQRQFEKEGNNEAAYYLARIDGQINRLSRLVSDLLDVTKIQAGRLGLVREAFDFDEWLKGLIGDLQQGNSHQINCSGKVGRAIVGDRDRLGLVVTNLITNGIKYSPRTKTIDVRVMADQNSVVVSVQDYGIGIPADMLEKIFERFFRIVDNRDALGLGLGLFISAEIVKLHGGNIWVESVEGEGSTFSFSLPSPMPC